MGNPFCDLPWTVWRGLEHRRPGTPGAVMIRVRRMILVGPAGIRRWDLLDFWFRTPMESVVHSPRFRDNVIKLFSPLAAWQWARGNRR